MVDLVCGAKKRRKSISTFIVKGMVKQIVYTQEQEEFY